MNNNSAFKGIFGWDLGDTMRQQSRATKSPAPQVKRVRIEHREGKVIVSGDPRSVEVNGVVVWRRPEVGK